MTVSQDKLNKIRLLIRKAQGTDNPHEAAAFMNKAQAMMAAEGVDMEAVHLSEIGEAKVQSRFSVSRVNVAENTLMHAVANAFGCKLLWIAKRSSMTIDGRTYRFKDNTYADFVFVGNKDRLGLATYAAEVLGRQLKKARTDFAAQRSEHYWDIAVEVAYDDEEAAHIRQDSVMRKAIRKQVTKDAESFAMGWAYEIQKRVVKFALNDQELQLLETYTKDIEGEAKNKKTRANQQFYRGVEAAKDADLHRPIDETGTSSSLLGQTRLLGAK